jgi:hypothetical protein
MNDALLGVLIGVFGFVTLALWNNGCRLIAIFGLFSLFAGFTLTHVIVKVFG